MLLGAIPLTTQACECLDTARPCERLRGGVVFAGRVLETIIVKHPVDKNSYTMGYSMRFAVEESLSGQTGKEVTIETGNGSGDCGTPLPPNQRYLIFAFARDGKLWTGICSGNRELGSDDSKDGIVGLYRTLIETGRGSIFGRVTQAEPIWQGDEVGSREPKPVADMKLQAKAERYGATTRTAHDGSYEFKDLPTGKYAVVPEIGTDVDFDRENLGRYEAAISAGSCANIGFTLMPATRIRGHVQFPASMKSETIGVVAIPTSLRDPNQFSGQWDFTDEQDRFDLWPLPPGDYYVGINITSSPKAEAPFPPTYYPGVTEQKAATIVHVETREVKDIELKLGQPAATRAVHFTATGFDGKPLRAIYIQLEDLRHPGDAASYVNVNLDPAGAGMLTIFAGYSYHLHGSQWVSRGNQSCAKAVSIPSGTDDVNVQFLMDRQSASCGIAEIDGLKK